VRQSQALDGVLETAYTAELVQLASQQLAKLAGAAVEQKRIEHLLGLSQGYLSHVKVGRHAPSPMLVAELVLSCEGSRAAPQGAGSLLEAPRSVSLRVSRTGGLGAPNGARKTGLWFAKCSSVERSSRR